MPFLWTLEERRRFWIEKKNRVIFNGPSMIDYLINKLLSATFVSNEWTRFRWNGKRSSVLRSEGFVYFMKRKNTDNFGKFIFLYAPKRTIRVCICVSYHLHVLSSITWIWCVVTSLNIVPIIIVPCRKHAQCAIVSMIWTLNG